MSDYNFEVDHEWRSKMLAEIASEEVPQSTRALLSLTYNDPDRLWVEDLLLGQVRDGVDPQLRALAVTCMGHLGRLHGLVSARLVDCLERLMGDPILGGIAEDAIGDIRHFARVI